MRQGRSDLGSSVISALIVAAISFACTSTKNPEEQLLPDPEKTNTWGEVSARDIVYPDRIGDFSLTETEEYADSRLGVRLKFVDRSLPRAVIDSYVYPITKQETVSLAHVLEWELGLLAQDVSTAAHERGQRAGKPASFPVGHSTMDLPRGLGLVAWISSPSDEYVSYAFLSVRDHHFFKLRVTVPAEEVELGRDDYLQEVLDVLYPAIHFRSPVQPPDLTVTVYRNVFLAPQHESCNLAGWMIYGVEMLDQVKAGNYLNTFERERAARKKALAYWEGKQKEGELCASDPFEAMSHAQAAGFLDEYVFEAYGRDRWPVPDGVDLEEWARWSEKNLEQHDPVLDPGVAVDWNEPDSRDADDEAGTGSR